jgi:hypothetical protein
MLATVAGTAQIIRAPHWIPLWVTDVTALLKKDDFQQLFQTPVDTSIVAKEYMLDWWNHPEHPATPTEVWNDLETHLRSYWEQFGIDVR